MTMTMMAGVRLLNELAAAAEEANPWTIHLAVDLG
jgi:hypothetical protein